MDMNYKKFHHFQSQPVHLVHFSLFCPCHSLTKITYKQFDFGCHTIHHSNQLIPSMGLLDDLQEKN